MSKVMFCLPFPVSNVHNILFKGKKQKLHFAHAFLMFFQWMYQYQAWVKVHVLAHIILYLHRTHTQVFNFHSNCVLVIVLELKVLDSFKSTFKYCRVQ